MLESQNNRNSWLAEAYTKKKFQMRVKGNSGVVFFCESKLKQKTPDTLVEEKPADPLPGPRAPGPAPGPGLGPRTRAPDPGPASDPGPGPRTRAPGSGPGPGPRRTRAVRGETSPRKRSAPGPGPRGPGPAPGPGARGHAVETSMPSLMRIASAARAPRAQLLFG